MQVSFLAELHNSFKNFYHQFSPLIPLTTLSTLLTNSKSSPNLPNQPSIFSFQPIQHLFLHVYFFLLFLNSTLNNMFIVVDLVEPSSMKMFCVFLLDQENLYLRLFLCPFSSVSKQNSLPTVPLKKCTKKKLHCQKNTFRCRLEGINVLQKTQKKRNDKVEHTKKEEINWTLAPKKINH
jgi:hypothetical protein